MSDRHQQGEEGVSGPQVRKEEGEGASSYRYGCRYLLQGRDEEGDGHLHEIHNALK